MGALGFPPFPLPPTKFFLSWLNYYIKKKYDDQYEYEKL